MSTTVNLYDVKELIERMKGINPSSYLSIGYAAIDTMALSKLLNKMNEPNIEWVLLDHFKMKPSLVILPLFFDDFSKETKTNIWKGIKDIDLTKSDVIPFMKSMLQEQMYRITQETRLEYRNKTIEVLYDLFIADLDRSNLCGIELEDDIKELFIYYLKLNKIYVYDLEVTILNTILYSTPTLTGILNLKNILDTKVKSSDVSVNLIFLASSYIYMTSMISKISVAKNRNNCMLQYLFSYKNIERMMINEWININ